MHGRKDRRKHRQENHSKLTQSTQIFIFNKNTPRTKKTSTHTPSLPTQQNAYAEHHSTNDSKPATQTSEQKHATETLLVDATVARHLTQRGSDAGGLGLWCGCGAEGAPVVRVGRGRVF
ncbi:uncharacterized protein K452DRAFT_293144 [Aplosporella prunicola CBS 121167]|uniref:Uncharacterized protein n=1 Tax=Aplosporella prunicola CBS 121167 TaxID=1176127 RepID=A0A6A6AWI1_9PEZI|nr:uncharacterized protein K452DRAFT_293144 [Aplosporella prunicola CBS 121167]KAF2135543.1 hypothetical protein K452DRAFT_293144 [Aplosporella prunicola CBS 121167]